MRLIAVALALVLCTRLGALAESSSITPTLGCTIVDSSQGFCYTSFGYTNSYTTSKYIAAGAR